MITMKTTGISDEARLLHSALIQRGLHAELEKYDGYKHIDMAIVAAGLNIEVDGDTHYTDPETIKADLTRNFYSEEKGFDTIRIPNQVIREHLDQVADAIATVARERIGSGK